MGFARRNAVTSTRPQPASTARVVGADGITRRAPDARNVRDLRRRQAELATRLGITVSTIVRWEREGAPIFDVREESTEKYAALLRWVQDAGYRQTPGLLRLAFGEGTTPVIASSSAPPEEGEPVLQLGLRAEMHRLEVEAAENYKRFKAFESGEPALRTSYHKVWTNSVQTLAKIAKEVPDHELEEGKVIPIEDIQRAVRVMLGEFRIAMDALPFRLASLLGGVNDPVERQRIVEREKEHVLKMLREPVWKVKIAGRNDNSESPGNEPSQSGGID